MLRAVDVPGVNGEDNGLINLGFVIWINEPFQQRLIIPHHLRMTPDFDSAPVSVIHQEDAAGVTEADLTRGPVLNQASMIIDAAVDGQGVALARTGLAAHDLITGRLVRPFSLALPVPYAYWIVCPFATAELPKIVTFRDWLLAEAAEDMERLSQL